MSDSAVNNYRSAHSALEKRLSASDATANLDALKIEIGKLYRAIDRDIDALTTLRDETRQLIERWKGLRGEQPSLAPAFAAERPTVHEDHIGASTFIEKGWSKLSLGDHEGAEVALRKAIELSPNDTQAQALA